MLEELEAILIYITHDKVEAMALADKVVVLNEDLIKQIGPPLELYQQPVILLSAVFLGTPKMAFLSARVVITTHHGVQIKPVSGAHC
jgi:multiple sugar transport system ATP-binding protein